jgi:hypothetical protein
VGAMPREQEGSGPDNSWVREIRGQFLVWMGIFGSVLTISAHWAKFVKLAGWMHSLVENFNGLISKFWREFSSIIHIEIPEDAAKALTFMAFWISLTIGSIFIAGKIRRPKYSTLLIGIILLPAVQEITDRILMMHAEIYNDRLSDEISGVATTIILFFIVDGKLLLRITTSIMIMCLLALVWKLARVIGLYINMYLYHPWADSGSMEKRIFLGYLENFLLDLVLLLPIMLAPTKALAKRLSFVLLGVAIIFGLSEVSEYVHGTPEEIINKLNK